MSNNILLWILKYEFFQTLPSDLKYFIKEQSEYFYDNYDDLSINEFAQTYDTNAGTYDYFISQYSRQHHSIKNGVLDGIPEEQGKLFWLCSLIVSQAKDKRLLADFDDDDRRLFRAFMVYMINRKY